MQAVEQTAKFGAPSVVYQGRPVDEAEETTEAFAYAFNLVSKEYFEHKNRLEDAIDETRKKMSGMSKYYVPTALLLIISMVLAFITNTAIIVTGLFGIFGMLLVYLKVKRLRKEVSKLNEELGSKKIEKKITFLSKLYVPAYLIPYKDGSMIFDAVGRMPTVTLPIYNFPSDKLGNSFNELQSKLADYEDKVVSKDVLTVEEIESYDSEIKTERLLEKQVLTTLKDILNYSSSIERTDVSVQIYGPETPFARSVQALFVKGLPHRLENEFTTIEVKFTPTDALNTVELMRGIRTTALEEDIVSAAKRWMDEIQTNRVLEVMRSALMSNIEKSSLLFDQMNEDHKLKIYDHICPECVKESLAKIQPYYKLVTTLRDYLGTAEAGFKTLNDDTHLKAFQDRLEEVAQNVKLDIPDEVIPAIIDYSQARMKKEGENFKCDTHKETLEKITIPSYTSVFASTATSIFEELRKPMIDDLKSSSQEIEQIYLSTRGQKLSLLPLESIQTQLKLKSKELEAAIREAEMILSSL